MEPIIKNEIRIDLVFKLIKDNWKNFLIVGALTFVFTTAIVFCIPRYYVAKAMFAPEYSNTNPMNGALGSAAAFLGVDISSSAGDAIIPEFYPHIIRSTDFLVSLMDVPVENNDGTFKGTYSDYLITQVKIPWWSKLFAKVKRLFVKKTESLNRSDSYRINPFKLTKAENNLLKSLSASISCDVDKETGIITLAVKAQDPLVAATMTNVLKERIQDVVVDYRTAKSKEKLSYFTMLCDSAYNDYELAQREYADYYDKHQGLSRQIYKIEVQRLENEMTQAFAMYNSLNQQRVMAESELLAYTPVFTTLQNVTVPIQPAGPKRKLIVFAMCLVSALLYLSVLVVRNSYCANE